LVHFEEEHVLKNNHSTNIYQYDNFIDILAEMVSTYIVSHSTKAEEGGKENEEK
jgi:GH25 family lysozyme M1 (1,4-beta-N-acetylmuramidase)